MARSPLIIDSPIGRLYCIDLGSGTCMLMIEQDGQAITYPLAGDEARRVANYMRAGNPATGPGTGAGRRPGTQTITDEELQELVDVYTSDEAVASGAKGKYTQDKLGMNESQVYSRLAAAKRRGIYVDAETD